MSVRIDYIFLGQTVPAARRRNKQIIQVCSAGYSPTLRQLVRIYPLPVRLGGHRWEEFIIPVVRNRNDSRDESYKINSTHRKTDLDRVGEDLQFVRKHQREHVLAEMKRHGLVAESIEECNERRLSLALIKPKKIEGYWSYNKEHDNWHISSDMFGTAFKKNITRNGHKYGSRIRFVDSTEHDLMFNSWDAYEWLRKHGGQRNLDEVWDAYKLCDPAYEHLLLVGNLNHYRRSWLVISVFHTKKMLHQASLFDAGSVAA